MRPAPPPMDPAKDTLGAAGAVPTGVSALPCLLSNAPLDCHTPSPPPSPRPLPACLPAHPRVLLTRARLPALSLPCARPEPPASSVPAAGGRLRLLRTPPPVLPHRPQGRAGGAPVWRDGARQQRVRLCARLRALLLRRGALALLLARRLPGADCGAQCELVCGGVWCGGRCGQAARRRGPGGCAFGRSLLLLLLVAHFPRPPALLPALPLLAPVCPRRSRCCRGGSATATRGSACAWS